MPKAAVPFIVVALAMVGDVGALGFGSVQTSTTLGHPLNLAVPLRLEDGETLTPECVSAEVVVGDRRLASDVVRVVIDRAAPDARERLLRIVTSVAIDEPVVTITLAAGCPTRLTRRLVAFADPPGSENPVASTLAQAPATPLVGAASGTAATASALPAAKSPRTAASAPPRRPRRAVAGSDGTSASNSSAVAATASAPRAGRTRSVAAAAPAKATSPQARLRLAPEEPSPNIAAVAAAEATASAAQAAASAAQAAASAADQRLKALETEFARMRTESQANRETMLQMRNRLADAEHSGRFAPMLLGLLALAIAAIAWLAWRLRKLSTERPPWWDGPEAAAVALVPDTPVASPLISEPARFAASTTGRVLVEPTMPGAMGRREVASAPVPMAAATTALSFAVSTPTVAIKPAAASLAAAPVDSVREPRREVTIEEQIDLEQQADFFIVLGQDEAAIDLLLNHLRGTGGTSPMPYLKLLEIHRRRGEREAYERARTRFNQRFNGVAPEWDMDPESGRSLEDYPEVVDRLQQVWWSPLDSMAELEALMFRRGEGAELFDLPAYQEVLSLYQLARDLLQHEASASPGEVDVLLPLADTNHGGLSVRHLDMDMESTRVLRPRVDVELPEPLDLDLSSKPMPYRPDEPETADVASAERDSRLIDFDLDAPPPGSARH